MHSSESHLNHWTRQFDQSPKRLETVFQITKLASSPGERDLIIGMTSKTSAQRLIAALAEQENGIERYRVSCFTHPLLPGLEMEQ
jgi:hypothetical protein